MEPKIANSTFYPNVPYLLMLIEFKGIIKPQYIKDEYIEYQEKKTNYYRWSNIKPELV